MHHNNFGNFYTHEVYAIPIPMGFPWEWDSHGVSHSHAHLYCPVVKELTTLFECCAVECGTFVR